MVKTIHLILGGIVAYLILKPAQKVAAAAPSVLSLFPFFPTTAAAGLANPFQFVTQPFVDAGQAAFNELIPGVPVVEQPLRTYAPIPDVRTIPIPSPERLAYQEAIGVPIVTPEQLIRQTPQAPAIDYSDPSQFASVGGASVPLRNIPARQQSAPSIQGPESSQVWVNPITQAILGSYVPGETPPSVLRLRGQDIFPSIRTV